MRKDLKKILKKLYAVEILQAIPEVSDDFVGPPEPPKERLIELWETIHIRYGCLCEKILRDHRIPAITIYGTTTEDILQGTQISRPVVSSISINDIEAAFNTNEMQNFLAERICEKYNAPQDPQKAKEGLAFIEEWFRTADGLTEEEVELLPNPWVFDDGIWDLIGRLGPDQVGSCVDPCLAMVHDLFTTLVRIARETHGIELSSTVPSLDKRGVQRTDPFWGAQYPALKTVMAKVINCVKEKLKRAIQEGSIA